MRISDAEDNPKEKRRKGTGKITLAEVAELVGVSTMTISRALRTPEKVNPELRRRIDAAVTQLGYVPNLQARSLASVRSDLILVVAPAFSSSGFLALSESLQSVLAEQGYTVMLAETGHHGLSNQKALEKILAYNPAAIVLFNIDTVESLTQHFASVDLPVLETGALNRASAGVSVGVDYSRAVQQVVKHLANLSLKNIALLCHPANTTRSHQILSGWNSAMLALNRSPHRVVTTHLPATIDTGITLFKDMMTTWGDLDALICTSEEIACGCMMACHSAGLNVPNTLSVASMGGEALSQACSPALTAIEFPWRDMGVQAGRVLVDLLNGVPVDRFTELPATLKVRASTSR